MSGRQVPRDFYGTQSAPKEQADLPKDQKPADDETHFEAKRSGQDGTSNDVFRVALRSFNGKRYIDLRVFFLGEDGEFLPTKKGVTVRLSELDGVIDALSRISAKVGPRR